MALPRVVREHPVALALSLATVLAALGTAGYVAAGGGARMTIRLAALTVALAVFAVAFWVPAVGERFV